MKKIATLLVFAALVAGVWSFSCKAPPSVQTATLPSVDLLDLDGKKSDLKQYAGKALIINFWATWCGPCREEIPILNDLYKKYSPHGLVILGISTDDDGASVVREFNKELPIHYPSYLTTKTVEEKFGAIYALPTTYFYDREGKQIGQPLIGGQTRSFFEEKIQQMVKQ